MTLYHHDGRPYAVAAAEAADTARGKMQAMIDAGRANAAQVIERVATEIPNNHLVGATDMEFFPTDRGDAPVGVTFKDRDGHWQDLMMHPLAVTQVAEKALNLEESKSSKAFATFSRHLGTNQRARELMAHNLNELYAMQGGDKRFLMREWQGELRGFLSNRFLMMDSGMVLNSFADSCRELGAVPVQAHYTGVKWAVKAILPTIFEPVENEVMVLGAILQNSDYGHGALTVTEFMLRLWCTNVAIGDHTMRRVHLGPRLDAGIVYSRDTYVKYGLALASETGDAVRSVLGPQRTTAVCEAVRAAAGEEVSPAKVKDWLKRHLLKAEADRVIEMFNSPDVQNLPPGQNLLRLSNAVSWVAGNDVEDVHRKLEMQEIAGKLFMPQVKAA